MTGFVPTPLPQYQPEAVRARAIARPPAPLDEWLPMFPDLKPDSITAARYVTPCRDWRLQGLARCTLCEGFVVLADRDRHAAAHARELAGRRAARRAQVTNAAIERLREVHQLRMEAHQ